MDRKTEMTAEEKQLLFKDICARLPYGVKCRQHKLDSQVCTMYPEYLKNIEDIEEYEPYIRSLSSMTKEEKSDLEWIAYDETDGYCTNDKPYYTGDKIVRLDNIPDYIDFMCKHHLDYRGLIEKGLALEAPKDMYTQKLK